MFLKKLKMKDLLQLFGLSLLWTRAFSASCITPLGQISQCVSLNDCNELLNAFNHKPLRRDVVNFLRESQCGYEVNVPKVCCGPLPDPTSQTTLNTLRPNQQSNININTDPVFTEDSYLTARDRCAIDMNGDRIYGGRISEIDESPWMALLGYTSRTTSNLVYDCGGALVNRRYVLTAAHCVVGSIETEVGKLTTARLGEYNLQTDKDCFGGVCADPVQEISVQSAYPHPGFSDNNVNRKDDIAIIRLAKRAIYSQFVQPICLADNSRLIVGSNVDIIGWGATLNGTSSPVKMKLSIPIFDKSQCVQKYKTLQAELTNGQICAGGQFSRDTCHGDSGGPLASRTASGIWEAVGVVSFGYGCGRDGWPGVYTFVPSYLAWIQETMRSSNL